MFAKLQDEKNGVVKLIMSGSLCSASLIADPEGNRNLLLTAQHCVGSSNGSPFWQVREKRPNREDEEEKDPCN